MHSTKYRVNRECRELSLRGDIGIVVKVKGEKCQMSCITHGLQCTDECICNSTKVSSI